MDNKWSESIEKLISYKDSILEAGGEARVAKQHSQGKLTARERMEALFDEGTFVELNDMITSRARDFGMDKKAVAGDGVITGYGKIHGRVVFASSQDFTVNGGSLGEAHAKKICLAMDKAMEMRAPFISMNDSGEARIEEGIDSLAGYADIFYRNTMASGVIPQISVILGPCAGGACYSPAICDYIFMTQESSQMYITGPQVVKSVTGEEITASDLGGANVHAGKSGVAHFVYENDLDCLNGVRRLIGYLPDNNESASEFVEGTAVDSCSSIPEIVPSNPKAAYDVRDVINTFIDLGSFMEVQKDFAKNIVVGFGRIAGRTVGFVANQPNYLAGALDIDASDKAARFIRFCDCFNIPLVAVEDVPGFLPGVKQEHNGIIRHGAKIVYAFAEATVPKITLITRKAYGGAYIVMNSKCIGADVNLAYPTAEIAVMGAEGACNILYRKATPEERAQKIEEYKEKFANPLPAAQLGYIDEIIQPCDTRIRLIQALEMTRNKNQSNPPKKHGNIPM